MDRCLYGESVRPVKVSLPSPAGREGCFETSVYFAGLLLSLGFQVVTSVSVVALGGEVCLGVGRCGDGVDQTSPWCRLCLVDLSLPQGWSLLL